jgi:hypothetical protein
MRAICLTWPAIGGYIAELHIPHDASIELRQEGDVGHYNAWGEPDAFLHYIKAVHPVQPRQTE